jgi:hypothetical protein
MKRLILILAALAILTICAKADGTNTFEFATIRWDGDNTYVILPSGKVDFIGRQLKEIKKPDRVDDRVFCLNIAMNSLGGKGYEFGGISGDGNTIVMKRKVNSPASK